MQRHCVKKASVPMATEPRRSMESLTRSEMAQILRLQVADGVQRLSAHFSWPEFGDERQRFHQEFVYDVARFTADRGFAWDTTIKMVMTAKEVFPKLRDLEVIQLSSLLKDILCESVPDATLVQQYELAHYLTDTLVRRHRLIQAVVRGAANMCVVQLHSEVQLPPAVCPLALGSDVSEWETVQERAEITAALQVKEEELRSLREGPRVSLENSSVPEEEQDKQGLQDAVQTAVKATEGQTLDTLTHELTLLSDIQQLRLQQDGVTSRGRQSTTTPSDTTGGSKQKRTAQSGAREGGRAAGD